MIPDILSGTVLHFQYVFAFPRVRSQNWLLASKGNRKPDNIVENLSNRRHIMKAIKRTTRSVLYCFQVDVCLIQRDELLIADKNIVVKKPSLRWINFIYTREYMRYWFTGRKIVISGVKRRQTYHIYTGLDGCGQTWTIQSKMREGNIPRFFSSSSNDGKKW